MAASITQGSTVASFAYDADHARMKMGVGSSTTYYAADLGGMAERIVAGASSTWHDYLNVDGKIVAMRTSGTPGTSWRYFVSDHLGSAASVTDGAGAVAERDAYDPWGKRRNLNGSDDATCSLASLTTRGYTGHEHIDAQCLINMNARVYDPTIARFMTPDTYVADADNLQDWNAYTYVNNRPLTLTDPTGHVNSCEGNKPCQDVQQRERHERNDHPYGDSPLEMWTGSDLRLRASSSTSVPPVRVAANDQPGDRQQREYDGQVQQQLQNDFDFWRNAYDAWKARQPDARPLAFKDFDAFKRAYGAAGNGMHWHHIVEQTQSNLQRFSPYAIHNIHNLMRLPEGVHRKISGYYSSIQPFTSGRTVRDWLRVQPYADQYEFGQRMVREFGAK